MRTSGFQGLPIARHASQGMVCLELGVNDVWPTHIVRQPDGRHVAWEYEGERPQGLIDKFFTRGNVVRQVLDIRGRVLKRGRSASALASERVAFEPPLR